MIVIKQAVSAEKLMSFIDDFMWHRVSSGEWVSGSSQYITYIKKSNTPVSNPPQLLIKDNMFISQQIRELGEFIPYQLHLYRLNSVSERLIHLNLEA